MYLDGRYTQQCVLAILGKKTTTRLKKIYSPPLPNSVKQRDLKTWGSPEIQAPYWSLNNPS